MKLHLGCGTIYLKGYVNVDVAPNYLISNAPRHILEQNTTTFENYYKHDFCKGSGMCIADVKSSIEDILEVFKSDIEEIVLIHVLEHFPSYRASQVLSIFNKILMLKGKLYIAVPDVKGTAALLAKAITPEEENWAIRLIHGTQRNQFSHHYCSYTRRTLMEILHQHGFGNFRFLPNINFYPAIHLEAFKERSL